MQKVLITGGAGFIGKNLSLSLLKNGFKVIALDNFSTSSLRNVEDLFDYPNYQFIEHNVQTQFDVEVDAIFNLACPASPIQYQRRSIQTTLTSVVGAFNALELAKKLGVPILQASTSEIYGCPEVRPQNERYWGHVNPIGVRSCYDEGKRCAESLFFDYGRVHGVDIKVARIFNTYGPFMAADDGRVVSNFVVNALKNSPISVTGDGSQTRSFCYVSDLISGLVALINTPKGVSGPFNLGNNQEMTVLELAKLVISKVGSKSQIQFTDRPEDDPIERCPDISNAEKVLNWRPQVAMDQGLEKTIAHFKQKIS